MKLTTDLVLSQSVSLAHAARLIGRSESSLRKHARAGILSREADGCIAIGELFRYSRTLGLRSAKRAAK